MQDRYAGDIGDYVKLALLRAIAPPDQMGVVWYRFPDEVHNADGRHVSYLNEPDRWRHLDPDLFDKLRGLLSARTISSLETSDALTGTSFFGDSVDSGNVSADGRDEWRGRWFEQALDFVKDRAVIFADPDNGLVCDNPSRRRQKKFGKQIPLSEAKALAEGRTAVVYHHNTRRAGGHDLEVSHWRSELGAGTVAVRANAFSCRTFFIINPTPDIRSRAEHFCDRWKKHRVYFDA